MKIKEGVRLEGVQTPMLFAALAADLIWSDHGKDLVITSGTDGKHSANSLHNCGRALDFRTNYFTVEQRKTVHGELKTALGGEFDVVLEETHIHCEYDPK